MKTHYGNDIFILAVPANGCKFEEILEKIERKIRICGAPMPDGRRIKLKYKDDEGDFITINTDDDVEMAFEMAKRTNEKATVTIMVE
jgi:cell division control protein 24